MSFVGKTLADGQLPTTQTAIYTVPASTRAIIKSADFVNNIATVQAVQLWIKRSGGTSRRVCAVSNLSVDEKIEAVSDGESWSLAAGDIIEGMTTTAAAVDYTITGAEETP
jgi:hypothetical protein